MNNLLFLQCLLMFLFTSSVSSEEMEQPLNSKQIIELIKGNTAEGHRTVPTIEYIGMTNLVNFKTYFRKDGQLIEKPSAHVGSQSGYTLPIHGTWWSRKGWLCYKLRDSVRGAGKRMCWRVVSLGAGSYGLYSSNGELQQTWDRIVEGDPHGLKSK
jgi:hypothetical protein